MGEIPDRGPLSRPRPTSLGAPAEEPGLSPFTGWARAHWEWAADLLLEGVRPFASPARALIRLPAGRPSAHGELSDGLEGFARTFLLAAFRLGGSGDTAPGDLAQRYADGLLAGMDPASGEAWPRIERHSQALVEAASIAVALFETRPWIWDELPETARQRLAGWLGQARGRSCYPNNWRLFPVVVHAFLKSVGAPYRQDEIDRNLDWVDRLHRGDGWYSDGRGERFDHYTAWAFHYDTALWCRLDGDRSDPARAAAHRARLGRFLEDYCHLFAADGAPLHHGRSLVYRFAAAAPFWAGALAGATPLAPGETRRLASGVLRHFLERGAVRDGVLTMGWHGEFLPMAQRYSGAASPYWASRAFLGLLLAPDHAVWTAREEPLPVERDDFRRAMPAPGFLAWGTRADGIVRVASHRSDAYPFLGRRAADPHYRKLAYSTHTAPEIADADTDSQISLLRGGEALGGRARFRLVAAADRFAASAHHPRELRTRRRLPARLERLLPGRAERVETVSVVLGAAELRIHYVRAGGNWLVRDGGFAVAGVEPPEVDAGDGWCHARRSDGLASLVVALHGFDQAGSQRLEGANAFGRYSAAPFLLAEHPGGDAVYASLVLLSGVPAEPDAARAEVAALEVERRRVLVTGRDGERLLVQLGRPERLDVRLGGVRVTGRVRYARVSPDGSTFVLPA